MKPRMIIDILMVMLLPLLMAYSLIGEKNHEILGICMFALFIAHHVINRKWWTTLFKGKYSPARAFNTAVNLLLAVYMVAQPVSGILMSKHILTGITIAGASSDLRTIHMTLAYWGFVILSVHLGLHVSAIAAKMKKKERDGTAKAIPFLAALVSAYGLYAFIKHGIVDYLLLRVQFAYFDPSASAALFILDYIAVMVFFAALTHVLQILLKRKEKTA